MFERPQTQFQAVTPARQNASIPEAVTRATEVAANHDESSGMITKGSNSAYLKSVSDTWDVIDAFLAQNYHRRNNEIFINSSSAGASDDQKGPIPVFDMSVQNCPGNRSTLFEGLHGLVTGLTWNTSDDTVGHSFDGECRWKIKVPAGLFVSVAFRSEWRAIDLYVTYGDFLDCEPTLCPVLLTLAPRNQIDYILRPGRLTPQNLFDFEMLFVATEKPLRHSLRAILASAMSGSVTTPGFGQALTPVYMDASYTISLPDRHAMLLSFASFSLVGKLVLDLFVIDATDKVMLSTIDRDGTETVLWTKSGEQNIPAELYNTSVRIHFKNEWRKCEGFKLLYTFHPQSAAPRRLNSGLFDCSVPAHYASFEQHVHCNLQLECEGGEDEGGHCPFSSPACQGKVAVADEKCFFLGVTDNKIAWLDARRACADRGERLAVVTKKEEVTALLTMLKAAKNQANPYVGFVFDTDGPLIYRALGRWLDNTISYTSAITRRDAAYGDRAAYHSIAYKKFLHLEAVLTTSRASTSFVCEQTLSQNTTRQQHPGTVASVKMPIIVPDITTGAERRAKAVPTLTLCPSGHFTRDFLACDLQAACHVNHEMKCPLALTTARDTSRSWNNTGQGRLKLVEDLKMFVCENQAQTLPYSLVCDFARDCSDGSDESFCEYKTNQCGKNEYQCDSGQCVNLNNIYEYVCANSHCSTFDYIQGDKFQLIKCDKISHCYDNSDEAYCSHYIHSTHTHPKIQEPPARIDFMPTALVKTTSLNTSQACPETHFSCPGEFGYCLPVYVRCNNMYDCPGHEDEAGCDNYTCPGFYRCRGASVCLHVDHLCDGLAQCPRRDDELLCEATCPPTCSCQGLAFVCHLPFQADDFPQLRYLDASGSEMDLPDLANNTYLIWLGLAYCRIKVITGHDFGNLQSLDLRYNMIESVSFDFVVTLPNLKEISLSENPLVLITAREFDFKQRALKEVDLSMTHLTTFDCGIFVNCPEVKVLNLSGSRVVSIGEKQFTCLPLLKELDLRGTNIKENPSGIFNGLKHVQVIFSDNYRHCCSNILSKSLHTVYCFAPFTGFSSCQDLLRLNSHRVSMWIMAFLSSVGNAGCLVAKVLLEKKTVASSTEIFMSNLSVANFLMGLYLCIIVTADVRFHGDFLSQERDWLSGLTCKAATFLSMTSMEASAFIVLLVAVDSMLSLRFRSKRLQTKSVWGACLFSWLVASLLAAVPLLPGTSTWEIYSRTSICNGMPTLRGRLGGHAYSFGVLVVLNFFIALATAACQAVVYVEVRSNYVSAITGQLSHDMVLARRVMTVVATEVACWFGVGVVGALSSFSVTPVSADVIGAVAVFVLPLKPALNPLLYAFSLAMEKRRLKEEARLMMLYTARARSQQQQQPATTTQTKSTVSKAQMCLGSKEEALLYFGQCLRSRRIEQLDIEICLAQYEHQALAPGYD